MMTDAQLSGLGRLSGPPFDQQFLNLMIEHHQGALRLADTETRDGRNAGAIALAGRITDVERAEIDRMRQLLTAG
jgi:uncharacterized protein (DUF305 family)